MTCKDVQTQAGLDEALADDDVTCVHIKSPAGVWLELRGNQGKGVEAFGSSTVRAFDSSTVREDTAVWLDHHGIEIVDGRAVLYKALIDDLTAGREWDKPTVYAVGVALTADDWRDNHDCGGGLHLSPTPTHAADYCYGATRYLRCTAAVEDVRPIVDGTPKCKVRALTVDAEVDVHGRDLVREG